MNNMGVCICSCVRANTDRDFDDKYIKPPLNGGRANLTTSRYLPRWHTDLWRTSSPDHFVLNSITYLTKRNSGHAESTTLCALISATYQLQSPAAAWGESRTVTTPMCKTYLVANNLKGPPQQPPPPPPPPPRPVHADETKPLCRH